MELKICKVCGEELPIGQFRKTRWGRAETCTDCITAKRLESRISNRKAKFGASALYDAEFEGKEPVEVIQLMSRAKAWLESRGYSITLRGEYREVKIREVKF